MQKQAVQEATQRQEKEKRQRLEVFVHFDMNGFKQELIKKLDPTGTKIQSCAYDFTTKGFRVRFNNNDFAEDCAFGSTMDNPKIIEVGNQCKIMRAPIESHCVFFLDPCQLNHPQHAMAVNWIRGQGAERVNMSEMRCFNKFRDVAKRKFQKYGIVTNIYRERGFMVVQFQEAESAQMLFKDLHTSNGQSNGDLQGVPIVFLKTGTPKKRDRKDCDKANPLPQKVSKKGKMDVEVKNEVKVE